MGLRFDPMGGGQFQQLVQQMVEAERQPIVSLENRKNQINKKLENFQAFKSTFGGINSALAQISDFRKLREFTVDLGDGEDFMNVSIDKEKAQPGEYRIKIDSLAEASAIISNGFEDPNEPVIGSGYVTLYTPEGDDVEVFVSDDRSSLRGIAKAINEVRHSAVQAEVIEDVYNPDNPWRLIIKSKKAGEGNAVEFPSFYFVQGSEDFYIAEETDPKDAYLEVDGFEIDAESNRISDFVEGINLELTQADSDREFMIKINVDLEKVSGKLKGIVDETNKVLDWINQQNKVDESSDTRTMFTGDTGLQTIEYRLRNLLHEGFPVTNNGNAQEVRFLHLHDMGVSFNRDGGLQFDANKFGALLEKDYDGVEEAISGPHGFAHQLGQVISTYTRPGDGLLAVRERGLQSRVNEIDDQIDVKERFLDRRTEQLVGQFSRLQSSLAELQSQQASVAGLAGAGGGGLNALLGGG